MNSIESPDVAGGTKLEVIEKADYHFEAPSDEATAVAVYATHVEAETVVRELQTAGFDMTKLSIMGRDFHTEEHVVGFYNMGDRMKSWGSSGAFWGGLWGLMFGGAFMIPGIGPILMAGPLVAAIVSTDFADQRFARRRRDVDGQVAD